MSAPVQVPASRPALTRDAAIALMRAAGDTRPLPTGILGVRGYYRNSLPGDAGVNHRNVYDDALFVVGPSRFRAFNGNTDPSAHGGRLAVLQPGIYRVRQGIHHPATPRAYPCWIQDGPFRVRRDDGTDETGEFYIHIHRGSYTGTSSEGCQTLYPEQWEEFYAFSCADLGPHSTYILVNAE